MSGVTGRAQPPGPPAQPPLSFGLSNEEFARRATAPARAALHGVSSYVLTVGINDYASPRVSDLACAVNDANQVADLFERQGARVSVRLRDGQATYQKIVEALAGARRDARPGEMVVAFLSGHGKRDGGQWQFCNQDLEPGGPGLDGLTILSPLMELVKEGHVVILALDSCNAGQAMADLRMARFINGPGGAPGGGILLLASSVSSQFSREFAGSGAFTRALVDAFRPDGADGDRDGVVTLKELRTFLPARLDDILHTFPKLPGMSWPDQDHLCFASESLRETLALGRSDLLPRRPATEPASRTVTVPPQHRLPFAPVGTWVDEWSVSLRDGTVLKFAYTLSFTADGRYKAVFIDEDREATSTAGSYRFEPFHPGAKQQPPPDLPLRKENLGALLGQGGNLHHFSLSYPNGVDYLDAWYPEFEWNTLAVRLPAPGFRGKTEFHLRNVGNAK